MHRPGCTMLLALLPALLSIALFLATLRLRPPSQRATVLPPAPTGLFGQRGPAH